ncbi:MAG: helix-turn-helix domain-containing protein [Clostridia bacterium]|nr:helix-turn-helix domain-containing protein [Clostridia bacterium]
MDSKSRLVKNTLSVGSIFAERKILSGCCSLHYHDFYEMDVVLCGSGSTVCNGEKFEIKRGMITFSTPEDFHEYATDDTCELITLQFGFDSVGANTADILHRLLKKVIYLDEDELCETCALLDIIIKRAQERELSSKLLECVILSVKNKLSFREYDRFPTPVQKAIIYIHSNFKEDIKMRDTAKKLGLCENYFSALFKANVGVSYKEYVRNLRLCHAANLIRYNSMPVTQAALCSGYNTQSHFDRDFKKRFGTSPSKIKNSQKAYLDS